VQKNWANWKLGQHTTCHEAECLRTRMIYWICWLKKIWTLPLYWIFNDPVLIWPM